ncbi:MAG: anhydro-N-acetylmuramic acid kinase [Alphaproteobacteria bacterium]|nr:anhydro-N-acetylmuramic acid kinase [Alphaproteobacteria bacterium]
MEVIKPLTALGLMSGTSMDGVDAALLVTDGVDIFEYGKALSRPYDMEMRSELRSVCGHSPDEDNQHLKDVERKMTLFHAEVVSELLDSAGLRPENVDVIGFHGHTVFHKPEKQLSVQIGDGDLLAEQTHIPVVNRFRNSDIANGGQGGPMMASYHAALARDLEKPLIVLNIGGVAKLTWIGENGELVAFDTGPGNALIDDWMMKKHGTNMDFDGNIAAGGTVNEKIIAAMMKRPYFKKAPPKSLDRDEFAQRIMDNLEGENVADGAATLTAFTAEAAAAAARDFLPKPAKRWIICGGGANNPTLMRMLRQKIDVPVDVAREVNWNGDFLEAQGYAFLAVRSLFGLPISFPTTTGVPHSMCGGMLHSLPVAAKEKKIR